VYSKRHAQLASLLKTNFNSRLERMVGRARDRCDVASRKGLRDRAKARDRV
jgi:hypothetical protein